MLSLHRNKKLPSHAAGEAIDIDVTPVMNMFIILIPFLVSMATFTHLSIIEFSLPPNVGTGLNTSKGKPVLKVTSVVAPSFLAITLGDSLLDSIPNVDNAFNYATYKLSLQSVHAQAAVDSETVVAVRDQVEFKDVVTVMDICRDVGFSKVGLSSAPDDPQEGE